MSAAGPVSSTVSSLRKVILAVSEAPTKGTTSKPPLRIKEVSPTDNRDGIKLRRVRHLVSDCRFKNSTKWISELLRNYYELRSHGGVFYS